jgi:sugar-specific transcriptional regulator TrmB
LSLQKINQALKEFGLSQKEAEIYISLAKNGTLTGGEISKLTKTHRPTVYRILKNLQKKGAVESTLESPIRYVALPFETILESNIRTKKEEVARIEKAKNDLLNDWKNIRKTGYKLHSDKFVVIEGRRRINHKISKMIEETKNQLLVISPVPELLRADRNGLLDGVFKHPLKLKIQFRFLTELSNQNLNAAKALLKRAPKNINLKGRNPNAGLQLSPRMVIRDGEEILFYITPESDMSMPEKDSSCLWTTSKELTQSFTAVFEELWRNSTDIEKTIDDLEEDVTIMTQVFPNTKAANKKFEEIINLAEKEIIQLTSVKGLIDIKTILPILKKCADKGVTIRIMAPITSENLVIADKLSKHFEVKHAPVSYLKTTIVDGKYLLQSRATFKDKKTTRPYFDNPYYTNDHEYIENMEKTLNNLWKTCEVPSMVTIESVTKAPKSTLSSQPSRIFHNTIKSIKGPVIVEEEKPSEILTEKEIINLHINAQRHPETSFLGGITRLYGFFGQAIVHPPNRLDLPEMLFIFAHYEKNSRFGTDDILQVFVRQKTLEHTSFLPVVYICDNFKKLAFQSKVFAGCFVNNNFQLAKRNQIQIQMHGNNLFCGWAMEIPLTENYTLPPGSILLEGYGDVQPNIIEMQYPSGYKLWHASNGIEAFVTYFHPSAKYSGPGTEGIILRDTFQELRPPKTFQAIT